jgi:hypothetical protein
LRFHCSVPVNWPGVAELWFGRQRMARYDHDL